MNGVLPADMHWAHLTGLPSGANRALTGLNKVAWHDDGMQRK